MNTSATRKRLSIGIAAIALALAGSSLGGVAVAESGAAAPKQARTTDVQQVAAKDAPDCKGDRVCFVTGHKVVSSYKDRGYQAVGPKAGKAAKVINSFEDDGALVYFKSGSKKKRACVKPGEVWYTNSYNPYGINIKNSPKC